MFRKQLMQLLSERPMTLPEIARATGERTADLAADLEHVLKSLKHTEWVAEIQPSLCRKCGFQFSTAKLRKPSRCPTCHSDWLTDPVIAIRPRP